MRLFRIGIAAAMVMAFAGHALAATPAKIDPAQRAQGIKEAPAVVQSMGLPCTVSDALYVGAGNSKVDGKDVASKVYEVACKEGLGYFIVSMPTGTSQFYDCLTLRTQADQILAKGKPATPPQLCVLPGNADPKQGLTPLFTQADTPCDVTAARAVGASTADKITIYEARCSTGHGYVLIAPRPGSTKTIRAVDCAQAGLFGQKCQFTSDAEIKQQIMALAAPKNPAACQANDARWVVTATNGDSYYEIGCADGKSGYIFVVDSKGAIKNTIGCADAQQLAGGCTLTNPDVAKTQEAGLYTQQAKTIGYPCTVSKYQTLGPETAATHREVVELVCNERPGSVWALLPTGSGGAATVMNCLRSSAVLHLAASCKLSEPTDTYKALAQEISGKGKTCDVTNARAIPNVRSQNGDDFVEVACSGGGGMVIAYSPAPIETVADVFTCKDTAGTTRACTLK